MSLFQPWRAAPGSIINQLPNVRLRYLHRISKHRAQGRCGTVRKDRASIEALIAEDFRFTSPLDNRLDRATYFKSCWPNSDKINGFDLINLVADGHRAFVTYEGHSTDGDVFRNIEIITVRDSQLVDVEVYFGWSIPHKAESGAHLTATEDKPVTVEFGARE